MDETNQEDTNKPPDANPPEELRGTRRDGRTGEKKIAEAVPEINETNTENTSPDTVMEVHHHPQLEHKPKAWKEYILEGLMIFVAVMMGFIAENIREGITNRAHARELISQLSHDLRNDTAQLNEVYQAELKILTPMIHWWFISNIRWTKEILYCCSNGLFARMTSGLFIHQRALLLQLRMNCI